MGFKGIGFFSGPGIVLELCGSIGMSYFIWTISALIAFLNALPFAELVSVVPKSGSQYNYFHEAFKDYHPFFGQMPSFVFCWLNVVFLRPAIFAMHTIISADYAYAVIHQFFNDDFHNRYSDIIKQIYGTITLGFVGYVNCQSLNAYIIVQDSVTYFKMLVCLFLIMSGAFMFMTAANMMENLYTALSAVKTLRSSVGQVFGSLANGLRADHGEEGKENKFLVELQDLLTSVNNHLRDVEQAVNALNQPPGPFSLGNTSFLSQECTHDRLALYSQLVLSYKWTDKIHEYSSLAVQLLNQNSLKRSYITSQSSKRRRTPVSSHNVSIQTVETLIAAIDRQFSDMNVSVCREFRSLPVGPTQVVCPEVRLTQQSISRDYQGMHDNMVLIPQVVIVQVTLGRVLQALLTLKGMMIEWVQVKGYGETLDLWTESRHKVFRKVTENCNAAMLHFYTPAMPEFVVRSFMTWLHSYHNLFSEPCKRCGNYLQSSLPPTCRDLRTLEPFHEECRI